MAAAAGLGGVGAAAGYGLYKNRAKILAALQKYYGSRKQLPAKYFE